MGGESRYAHRSVSQDFILPIQEQVPKLISVSFHLGITCTLQCHFILEEILNCQITISSLPYVQPGEVSERLKEHAWKVCVR